jgi:hypothetical protein
MRCLAGFCAFMTRAALPGARVFGAFGNHDSSSDSGWGPSADMAWLLGPLGNATGAVACAALADTGVGSGVFIGWAWVGAADGPWALGCYGRVDDGRGDFNASCFPKVSAPPCSVALGP